MNRTIYLNSPETKRVAKLCFPDWNGNKIKLEVFRGPFNLSSYWDGGSRSYYSLINLITGETAMVPENGSLFSPNIGKLTNLPINCVLGEQTIFCGKDLGVTLYLNEENLTKMLPNSTEDLSLDCQIVLTATAMLKSSYAGVSNYRFVESRRNLEITAERWENAKSFLINNGYLNKAGAITDNGRNARKYRDFYAIANSIKNANSAVCS
jgi:hypothetical protein